jgi:hypothetical protein
LGAVAVEGLVVELNKLFCWVISDRAVRGSRRQAWFKGKKNVRAIVEKSVALSVRLFVQSALDEQATLAPPRMNHHIERPLWECHGAYQPWRRSVDGVNG